MPRPACRAHDEISTIIHDRGTPGIVRKHIGAPRMNAYTMTRQTRIQQRDLATILRTGTGSYMAAVSLAGLERQRGWQAESEVEWLLKQNRVTPQASVSRVALLRQ